MPIERPTAAPFSPASALVLFVVAALLLVGLFGREPAPAPERKPAVAAPEPRALPGLNNFALVISSGTSAEQLLVAAKAACGEASHCTVFGWGSEAEAARGWPLTDREVATQRFGYAVNRTTGFERAQWDCRIWPRANRDECLAQDAGDPEDD